jgi:hypothetical protein
VQINIYKRNIDQIIELFKGNKDF